MLLIDYEGSAHLYKASVIIISMLFFSVTILLMRLLKFENFEERAFNLDSIKEKETWQTSTGLPGGIFIYLHRNEIIMHTIPFAFTYILKE